MELPFTIKKEHWDEVAKLARAERDIRLKSRRLAQDEAEVHAALWDKLHDLYPGLRGQSASINSQTLEVIGVPERGPPAELLRLLEKIKDFEGADVEITVPGGALWPKSGGEDSDE